MEGMSGMRAEAWPGFRVGERVGEFGLQLEEEMKCEDEDKDVDGGDGVGVAIELRVA